MKDKYEKESGTNVKGPKEAECVQPKTKAEYQGGSRDKGRLYNQGSGEHIGAREIIGEIR